MPETTKNVPMSRPTCPSGMPITPASARGMATVAPIIVR
jgi:hypothetical protein